MERPKKRKMRRLLTLLLLTTCRLPNKHPNRPSLGVILILPIVLVAYVRLSTSWIIPTTISSAHRTQIGTRYHRTIATTNAINHNPRELAYNRRQRIIGLTIPNYVFYHHVLMQRDSPRKLSRSNNYYLILYCSNIQSQNDESSNSNNDKSAVSSLVSELSPIQTKIEERNEETNDNSNNNNSDKTITIFPYNIRDCTYDELSDVSEIIVDCYYTSQQLAGI